MRAWRHSDFSVDELVAAKADTHVSVCLPARDEESTVGAIVTVIRNSLAGDSGLVDEILVIDDGSRDATATVAADAGARVVASADVLRELAPGRGKGDALWKALYAAKGDVLVFCDADVRDFTADFVVGLLGPLLVDRSIGFVKGFYQRPLAADGDGGGRVTELVARPLLALLFPDLAEVAQPLAGEFAGRRAVLEQVPFVQGYGVDIALLIDVAGRFGIESIGQVDLGSRTHRNRPLAELSPQALDVLAAALRRAGVALPRGGVSPGIAERPPMVDLALYRNWF